MSSEAELTTAKNALRYNEFIGYKELQDRYWELRLKYANMKEDLLQARIAAGLFLVAWVLTVYYYTRG